MSDSNLPTVPDLIVHDGAAFASSLDVARVFGKRHDDVLKRVDRLRAQVPDPLRNFAEGSYTLPGTGTQIHRCFELTRDGFTLLAMGFTGAKALQFKLAYIAKFNEMERVLRVQADADVFALPGGEVLTRQMLRADLSSAFKHYIPQILANMPSVQQAAASSSRDLGFMLGVALDGEFPRFAGSVKKILCNPENWRAAGVLPLPAPTDETTYLTATEICWQVVPDQDMHSKLPCVVGAKVVGHARDHKWPQGATDRRSRSHQRMPTYPLSRVKEWLAAGAADAIRAENDRLHRATYADSQGVIPFPASSSN